MQQISNQDKLDSVLSQFDYSYDPVGNITDWGKQLGSNPATATAYGYDKAYQLLNAVEKAVSGGALISSESLRYDRVGNRALDQQGMSSQESAYNDLNQLTGSEGGPTVFAGALDEPANVTVGGNTARLLPEGAFEAELDLAPGTHDVTIEATDGSDNTASDTYQITVPTIATQSYLYDDDGNLVTAPDKTYEWDALNRLTAINYTGTNLRTEFEYDGFSRRARIIEKDNSVEQSNHIYIWDGASIAEKRDSTGATVLRQYFGNGFTEGANDYYYTHDHLGSIREVVASDGTTVESQYDYTPWGEVTRVNGALSGIESDFLYTGHLYHEGSGLYLAQYRAYSWILGRWLSRDPLYEAAGINLYGYVINNPISLFDPNGLDWLDTASNYAAGFGDAVTFGFSKWLRDDVFTDFYDGTVDYCSTSYEAGEWSGIGASLALGGKGAVNVASKLKNQSVRQKLYEIGQKTLTGSQYNKYSGISDPVKRGIQIVRDQGWTRASIPSPSGLLSQSHKTIQTGLTPGATNITGDAISAAGGLGAAGNGLANQGDNCK